MRHEKRQRLTLAQRSRDGQTKLLLGFGLNLRDGSHEIGILLIIRLGSFFELSNHGYLVAFELAHFGMPVGGVCLLQRNGSLELGSFRVEHRLLCVVQALSGANLLQKLGLFARKLTFQFNHLLFDGSHGGLERRRLAFKIGAQLRLFRFERHLGLLERLSLIRRCRGVRGAPFFNLFLQAGRLGSMLFLHRAH